MSESYQEYLDNLKAEQSNMSRDEVVEQMKQSSEYSLDLDNLPSVKHNWVHRGAKMSCEGANHPHHSHFLVKR